ncbi:MAG TPA: ABC transporter substrate-binding protein, partial [Aequorivita sp.]|nr:ABC transporter substrate-binding protein [Aequorivita sp.]
MIKILSIFTVLLTLLSCTKKAESDRDHLVFRYNEHGNIPTLDPAFARNPQAIWPDNQLYNGLVQLDDSLNIKPDIAQSWVIDDSTNTYTFSLRNDVYFHQNVAFAKMNPDVLPRYTRKVIASDFVYSFDRLTDEKVASSGSWVMNYVEKYWAE